MIYILTFRRDGETKREKLAEISLSGLRGVVGDEEDSLPVGSELVEYVWDTRNDVISFPVNPFVRKGVVCIVCRKCLPDYAVAIEDEDISGGQQLRGAQQLNWCLR